MKVSAATPPPYTPSGPIKPKQHKLAPEDEEIVNRLLKEYEKEVANKRTTRTFWGALMNPFVRRP